MFGARDLPIHPVVRSSARSALIIRAVAALALALFTGAGHGAAEEKPSPQAPQREQFTLSLDTAMKPWTGDLDGMIDRQIIRVLTVYSKTFYFVDRGAQRGTTYDFFRVFEEDLNKQLAKDNRLKHKALKVRVVLIPVARNELLPALAAGKGDIAASNLTVTEERKHQVDFSLPVYRNVSEVVVSGADSPAVSSVDELAGQVVFVRKSSSYYESLTALNQRFANENKAPVILKEAPEALEDEDLIEMLNAGMIPLIVVDKHKADFWKKVFPTITVHEDIVLRSGGDIAWAMRKGSPQLKAVTDDFIARHGQGTAIGNMILARFFKNDNYVKAAVSESERKKFSALVQYFQRYGDQYDVDWILMAAQGYQESRLDQAAKSKVGAIGVMQVMPATGKELGVGNIAQVEPNINAGIKYMRWMIDQYYGKEPMTNLDKALFAFASYNAGAGKISRLRKEAVTRGLDPNVWFHNVEYIAAEKIGAETVTYVSNIYKYYIAYQLLIEAQAAKEEAAQKLKDQSKAAL